MEQEIFQKSRIIASLADVSLAWITDFDHSMTLIADKVLIGKYLRPRSIDGTLSPAALLPVFKEPQISSSGCGLERPKIHYSSSPNFDALQLRTVNREFREFHILQSKGVTCSIQAFMMNFI